MLNELAAMVSTFGVLVHWYNGAVYNERIELGKPQRTDVAHLRDAVIEEDRWLWVGG